MSGTTVAVVTAHDADDPHEGDNARLSYSLLKNVIDERSRLPMFTVDRQTGALRTAVCCLDREHTSSYGLVLAATDGGGLQGTCTVTVNIDDVNDVPPSFVRSHVDVLVPEHRQPSFQRSSSHGASSSIGVSSSQDVSSTDGVPSSIEVTLPKEALSSSAVLSSNREFPSRGLPSSKSRSNASENFISTLVVTDPDTSNVFAYRVVPGSGHGWQLVEVAASTAGADLFSRVPLDFENPQHRAGLNFRVQVTDQGDMPWSSHPRVSECSVTVTVQDLNDNRPAFSTASVEQSVALPEDLPLLSFVASFSASDLDTGASGLVTYGISAESDPGGVFRVSDGGSVTLNRGLDRESRPLHLLSVLAWDSGSPPLTATATLTVTTIRWSR
ncbi:putative neural-cadherin 2 [Hyalella azteca]|uniref:Neural-cadherin 2 n=1 Tax=Hyalella azteca TaxID=294128 RepID=A0A8B7PGY1_HYAAZ|nr:putative neural-cadherin 2 [Hyalella azteca]